MRICQSQYFQDKLGQKINKQGVLIREGVGKIKKLINGGPFIRHLRVKLITVYMAIGFRLQI